MTGLFAYRTHRVANNCFTRYKDVEHADVGAIEAVSVEDARDKIIACSSIAAIHDGLTIEIVEVSLTNAQKWHSKYNGDPFEQDVRNIVERVS